jgi:hypothetical protein
LNTLQTNASVLDQIRKEREAGKPRKDAEKVWEVTTEYLTRLGYKVSRSENT